MTRDDDDSVISFRSSSIQPLLQTRMLFAVIQSHHQRVLLTVQQQSVVLRYILSKCQLKPCMNSREPWSGRTGGIEKLFNNAGLISVVQITRKTIKSKSELCPTRTRTTLSHCPPPGPFFSSFRWVVGGLCCLARGHCDSERSFCSLGGILNSFKSLNC